MLVSTFLELDEPLLYAYNAERKTYHTVNISVDEQKQESLIIALVQSNE